MAGWSKLTVAKLKEECAERDISTTGLKLKQQFIDKLEEWDSNKENGATNAEHKQIENTDGEAENVQKDSTMKVEDNPNDSASPRTGQTDSPPAEQDTIMDDARPATDAQPLPTPVDDLSQPQAPAQPESEAQDPGSNETTDVAEPIVTEAKYHTESSAQVADVIQIEGQDSKGSPSAVPAETGGRLPNEQAVKGLASNGPASADQTPASTSVPPAATQDSTRSSSVVPPAEVSEDARKRKRRSVTPTPQAEEVALKKIKANDGSPLVAAKMEAEREQAAIDEAGVDADAGPLAHGPPAADIQPNRTQQASSDLRDVRSASPIDERTVAPALHAATSTLYIRNFKRPVRQPDLQAHIASLARSSRDDPDSNPIKFFYLDVLRTHAFVRLHSISGASRVRSAIHQTRWPDEPTRELLWADFIPDNKAEVWANEEADASTGSGFGGRGKGGKKWEVVYPEGPDGVEAILQDADEVRTASHPRKPSFASTRKPSTAWEGGSPAGVHPDRALLVSGGDSRTLSRGYDEPPPPLRQPKNAEKSFAALDELFSSTEKTKPKLYYKPVAPQVVDERMEMIKDLRVGHNGRGRSGDEGMKRFTFEWERGKQEWVDKGPEFGYGKKGRDRLVGERGRGGGGFRGRGGGSTYAPRRGPRGDDGQSYQDWDAPPAFRRGGGGGWRGGY